MQLSDENLETKRQQVAIFEKWLADPADVVWRTLRRDDVADEVNCLRLEIETNEARNRI